METFTELKNLLNEDLHLNISKDSDTIDPADVLYCELFNTAKTIILYQRDNKDLQIAARGVIEILKTTFLKDSDSTERLFNVLKLELLLNAANINDNLKIYKK